MASIQLSSCEDKDEENSSCNVDLSTNTPTNDYNVIGQLALVKMFGGIMGCAIVEVTKDGVPITDAVVTINGEEVPNEDMGFVYSAQLSLSPGSEWELEVSHNGSIIASGNTCIPTEPTISNLDSGDVHTKNTSLTVQWNSVDYATSIIVEMVDWNDGSEHSSGFLDPSITSYTIPDTVFNFSSTFYDTISCNINVSAVSGVSPGVIDENDEEIGYNIEGASGVFMGVNQSSVEILVPTD
tara:strand:- start:207 stop:926 length:720 start_codon:yes stop_codon:yes gene_type:complete